MTPQSTESSNGSYAGRPGLERNINVSIGERKLSVAAGAALTLLGFMRGGIKGMAISAIGAGTVYRGLTGHCKAYELLGVDTAEDDAPEPDAYYEHGVHIDERITVARSADDCYAQWRELQNLPHIMTNVENVVALDNGRSRWIVKGPGGYRFEWQAEIVRDEEARSIAWRTVGKSDVYNAGSVRFIPAHGEERCELRVLIDYIPPIGGEYGAKVLRMLGQDPAAEVREDLRRFKRLMEMGEPIAS